MAGGNVKEDRRMRRRFPVNLNVRFSAGKGGRLRTHGQGKVSNVSSQGVAFRTETPLAPGWYINASMEWPVTLNGDCVLRVSMEGRVLRVEDGLSVMSIDRHEFRTGGRVAAPATEEAEVLKQRIDGLLGPAAAPAA
jgi:hypothetical protein